MANNENLKPLNTLPKEDAKRIRAMGAVARGIKKQKQKLLKETINEFLQAINPESGQTFQIDLVNAMIQQALSGDVSAFNTVRDTAGQKPKEDVQAVVMPVINIKGL